MNFFENFNLIENCKAKILLEHCLFGKQLHHCANVQVINDEERLGVILKNQEIFLYKKHITYTKMCDRLIVVSDGQLTITITVNKL